MNFGNTFLYKLHRKHKKLFFFTFFYLIITICSSFLKFQITPFYNWGMFSFPAIKTPYYSFIEIYCDGKLLNQPHTFNDYQRIMVHYPSAEYLKLIDSNHINTEYKKIDNMLLKTGLNSNLILKQPCVNDSLILAYPVWLKIYIKTNLVEKFDTLELYEKKVKYENNGTFTVIDKKLIFKQ